jgi:hypothetical protein
MLPFFRIPTESYRGFRVSIVLPSCLAIWMLKGGMWKAMITTLVFQKLYDLGVNLFRF